MKIVYSTDLSIEALAGAHLAFALAGHLRNKGKTVDVDIVHVVEEEALRRLDQKKKLSEDRDNLRRIRESIQKWLAENLDGDHPFELVIREGDIAAEIKDHVRETDADYLVLGQSGKGTFARMILGSTAHKIAQKPPCKLLIADREFSGFEDHPRIAVGVDFDETSHEAIDEAAVLARLLDANIDVIHAYSPPTPSMFSGGLAGYAVSSTELDSLEAHARDELDEFLSDHDDELAGLTVRSKVLIGSPTRQLIEYIITEGAALGCMGTIGRHSTLDQRLGSVAGGVVRHMPCSMLLVPPTKK